MIGFDDFGKKEDVIINPLGLEYLDIVVQIDDFFNCTITNGLELISKINNIEEKYNKFKDNGFLESAYKDISLSAEEIDKLVINYNITPSIIKMMLEQSPDLHYGDFVILLTRSSESFIGNDEKTILNFFKRFNVSFQYISSFLKSIIDIDKDDYLREVQIIIDNNLDYRQLNSLKEMVQYRTKDNFVLFENIYKIEGYSNILTPIYKLKDGTLKHLDIDLGKTKIKIEPDYNNLKYNELFNTDTLQMINNNLILIEHNISTSDKDDRKFLQNKYLNTINDSIITLTLKRIDDIIPEIKFCLVQSINKQLNKNETVDSIVFKLKQLKVKFKCGKCLNSVFDEMLKLKKNITPSVPYDHRSISTYHLSTLQKMQECLKDILPDLPDDRVYLNTKENPCYQQGD